MIVINQGISLIEIDKVFVMGMQFKTRDKNSCRCYC